MLGVHQPVGKFAVVGKQQQPLGVHIQPSDGIDPQSAVRHKLGGIGPALFIRKSGHIAPGLIEHDVHIFTLGWERFPIHQNFIADYVGTVAQIGNSTVYRHSAGENHFLSLPPGGYTPGGQYFLQALAHLLSLQKFSSKNCPSEPVQALRSCRIPPEVFQSLFD